MFCNSAPIGATLLNGTVYAQIEPNTTIQFTVETSGFYIIMLHVSAFTAIMRQNLYKNVQKKVNINVKRGFSVTSKVMFVYTLS